MKQLLSLILAALLSACATHSPQTLYQRLGAAPGLERLVDTVLQVFADDPRVAPSFKHTEIKRFRTLFIEHLCALTDGPCRYTGASMREAHAHLHISEATFNAVVEDLQDAMTQLHYSQPVQNALLNRLAKLRSEVISDAPLPSTLIER